MQRQKQAKRKKPRRIVLGVGHPWFTHTDQRTMFDTIYLTPGAGESGSVPFKFRNVGNWNKVRLVIEVLK